MPAADPPFRWQLPRLRGTQIGLSNPRQIEQLKADMRQGQFAYGETHARICGVRDPSGTYHIKVGHHRMVAALELYRETGDPSALRALMQWGLWDDVAEPPLDSRPMPARYWWGALRNWLGI